MGEADQPSQSPIWTPSGTVVWTIYAAVAEGCGQYRGTCWTLVQDRTTRRSDVRRRLGADGYDGPGYFPDCDECDDIPGANPSASEHG